MAGPDQLCPQRLRRLGGGPQRKRQAECHADLRQNLAAALLAAARYTEAEAILRGLVTDNPKNSEAWYFLGMAQKSQLKDVEARQSLKTAANLGNARAKDALK